MSAWEVAHKAGFLNDYNELSKTQQKAVANATEALRRDPVTPRGNTIKKLQGYENVWRYRLGDFRLIYEVDRHSQVLRLLAIGPRASVYEQFNYRGWDAPGAAIEFGPRMEQSPQWMRHPEWFKPKEVAPQKERLPQKLTPARLERWGVPAADHAVLMRCLYTEDLMNSVNKGVSSEVLGRVLEGLFPAKVEQLAAQPDQVLLDPQDLLAYADGTLTAFLLRLDETQRPLTNWALSGPTLVKGGPGAGKSTVALYRIRAIVEHALRTTGRIPSILFTTYTNALINFSESLLRQLLRDPLGLGADDPLPEQIRVTTMYQVQREILTRCGRRANPTTKKKQLEALQAARRKLDLAGFDPRQQRRIRAVLADLREEYLVDEFDWVIEGQNCRDKAAYMEAERAGRAIPFHQSLREAVWALYELYRHELRSRNRHSYSQIAQEAFEVTAAGQYDHRWDYVLVDEAQDLPPVGVALCVELCKDPAGLFLTADANQSLYNSGFRWTYVHRDLNVQGRTRILRRNYRSTQEIADAAAEIMLPVEGYDGEAIEQEFVHSGAYPVVYAAKNEADEARWIAQSIYEAAREMRLPPNAAAVLAPLARDGERLARLLSDEGLPAVFMRSRNFDLDDAHVKVTTLHAAKGLEFPIVVIARAEEGHLPWDATATDREELSEFLLAQRRLFYVGCTRAMRYLFVTHYHASPSPFLGDLSEDRWMWFNAPEGKLRAPKKKVKAKTHGHLDVQGKDKGEKEGAVQQRGAQVVHADGANGELSSEAVVVGTWAASDVTTKAIEALQIGHEVRLVDMDAKKKVNRILTRNRYKSRFDQGYTEWSNGERGYRVFHNADGHDAYSRVLRRER